MKIVPFGLGAAIAMLALSPVGAQENDQNYYEERSRHHSGYGERSRYESGRDSQARRDEDSRNGWHRGRSMGRGRHPDRAGERDRVDGGMNQSARFRIIRGNSRFDISCPANEQLRNCLELASKFIRDTAKNSESDEAKMEDGSALGMQEPDPSTEKD